MFKTSRLIFGLVLAACFISPGKAQAADTRSVSCSLSVDYLVNDVLRFPFQKDFVVSPGAPLSYDFSTFTRFRFLDASAQLESDNKTVNVSIGYYNDIGVFEYIDFRTGLKVLDDNSPRTTSGRSSYYTELGTAGEHTTSWTLTCQRVKN